MDEKLYVEPGPKAERIAMFLRSQGINGQLKRDDRGTYFDINSAI